jgi:hypothetical protein
MGTKWTRVKLAELERDYFPGLDPAQMALKLFDRDDRNTVVMVENRLSQLGLRKKRSVTLRNTSGCEQNP